MNEVISFNDIYIAFHKNTSGRITQITLSEKANFSKYILQDHDLFLFIFACLSTQHPWKNLTKNQILKNDNFFDFSALSEFQWQVYTQLLKLDFGQLIAYSDLALSLNKPQAARAVGQALGKNPLPIVFPCHRVISKTGEQGGFSAGPIIKAKLINLEQNFRPE